MVKSVEGSNLTMSTFQLIKIDSTLSTPASFQLLTVWMEWTSEKSAANVMNR